MSSEETNLEGIPSWRQNVLPWKRVTEIARDVREHINDQEYIHSLFGEDSPLSSRNEKMFARMAVFGEMERLKNKGTPHPYGEFIPETILIRVAGLRATPEENKELRKDFNFMKSSFFQYLAYYERKQLEIAGIKEEGIDRMKKGMSPEPNRWRVAHVQACAFSQNLSDDELHNPRNYTMRLAKSDMASNKLGVDDPWMKLEHGTETTVLTIASDGSVCGKFPGTLAKEVKPLLEPMYNDDPMSHKGIGGVLEEYDAWRGMGCPNRMKGEVLARPPHSEEPALMPSRFSEASWTRKSPPRDDSSKFTFENAEQHTPTGNTRHDRIMRN